jgi:hypothetical protein
MLKGFRDFLLKVDLISAAVGLVMALATFTKSRPCPECTTQISVAARRCPSCTAVVIPEAA